MSKRGLTMEEASAAAELPSELRNLQKPTPPKWFDKEPPLPIYIVDPYLQAGENAVVAGAGGVGKNFFLLSMTVSICTGTPFYGYHVPQKRRVLYVMAERSTASFRRRLYKVTQALLPQGDERKQFKRDLMENCVVRILSGEHLSLIEFEHGQWVPAVAAVDELIAELRKAKIEVMILDPMSRLHGGDENDNSAMSAFTKALERISQATGCSIVLVHHTGKSGSGDQYGFRGASAIGDNTSEMIILSKVEGENRKRLNLAQLDASERSNDIVLVHHARCSDGRAASDLYLIRSDNGVLVEGAGIGISEPQLMAIKIWAGDKEFTKREFTAAHRVWGMRISRDEARRIYSQLITAGRFAFTGGKRGKGKFVRFVDGRITAAHCPPIATADEPQSGIGGGSRRSSKKGAVQK
jgi:regulatory protein RepA